MSEPLDAPKDLLEDLRKAQKSYEGDKHAETCPSCGYCPHCGRRNEPFGPSVSPSWPTQPWWPYYPVVWGTTTISFPTQTGYSTTYLPLTP